MCGELGKGRIHGEPCAACSLVMVCECVGSYFIFFVLWFIDNAYIRWGQFGRMGSSAHGVCRTQR